jgi:hypothetical protein
MALLLAERFSRRAEITAARWNNDLEFRIGFVGSVDWFRIVVG